MREADVGSQSADTIKLNFRFRSGIMRAFRLDVDKFEQGNVGACPPRLWRGLADRAERVTRMRYQEFSFDSAPQLHRTMSPFLEVRVRSK